VTKEILLINGINVGGRIQIPVGLVYLASSLKKHGYKPVIYQVIDDATLATCRDMINKNDYLFVGFTVWLGPSSLNMLDLAGCAKKRNIPTVVGGKFISSLKHDALNEANIDVAAIGYAEETVVELADCFFNGGGLSKVKGIIFRDKRGEIITTPPRIIENTNLDIYDYDLSLINDWSQYVIKPNSECVILDPLETQRGCLFRCRFCFHCDDGLYSANKKKKIYAHSIDYVVERAKELKKLTNVKKLSFCDDEFWIDGERSLKIVERLKQIDIEMLFMRIRFTSINDDMLKELKKLGVYSVACGLESGNARVLKTMNKGLTLDVVKEKIEILNRNQVVVNTCLILGCPTETKEEMVDSVRFSLGLRKINKNLNIVAFFYSPQPSTDFGTLAEKEGFKRPRNIKDWVSTSAENMDIGGQWLPWYNETQKKYMKRRNDYFFINSTLCSVLYGYNPKSRFVKTLWLPLFLLERVTFFRLYYWNFSLPIDAKIGMSLYRLYSRCRQLTN